MGLRHHKKRRKKTSFNRQLRLVNRGEVVELVEQFDDLKVLGKCGGLLAEMRLPDKGH